MPNYPPSRGAHARSLFRHLQRSRERMSLYIFNVLPRPPMRTKAHKKWRLLSIHHETTSLSTNRPSANVFRKFSSVCGTRDLPLGNAVKNHGEFFTRWIEMQQPCKPSFGGIPPSGNSLDSITEFCSASDSKALSCGPVRVSRKPAVLRAVSIHSKTSYT